MAFYENNGYAPGSQYKYEGTDMTWFGYAVVLTVIIALCYGIYLRITEANAELIASTTGVIYVPDVNNPNERPMLVNNPQ